MKGPEEFLEALRNSKITWVQTRKDRTLFEAIFEGEHVQLRLNDFPDEPIYTVFFRGLEIHLEESPRDWHLLYGEP